jgi:hypothetical protein
MSCADGRARYGAQARLCVRVCCVLCVCAVCTVRDCGSSEAANARGWRGRAQRLCVLLHVACVSDSPTEHNGCAALCIGPLDGRCPHKRAQRCVAASRSCLGARVTSRAVLRPRRLYVHRHRPATRSRAPAVAAAQAPSVQRGTRKQSGRRIAASGWQGKSARGRARRSPIGRLKRSQASPSR